MNSLTTGKNRRVLVIDDNHAVHDDFRKILSPDTAMAVASDATEAAVFGPIQNAVPKTEFAVDSAYQGQEGLRLVQTALTAGRPYALAFVDVRMPPGWDGVETTQKIWQLDPNLQIVLCTAYSDYSWEEMYEKLGQRDGLLILKKPFDAVEAFQLAHALTEKWWLHQQARRKMEKLEGRVAERTRELQETNQTLQQKQTQLRVLFDLTPAMICFKDTENRVLRANQRMADSAGMAVAEIEGKSVPEIFPAEAAKFFADDLEVIRSGAPKLGIIETVRDGAGHERWVQTDKVPFCDPDGKITGIVVMAQDITERKRTEEKLRLQATALDAVANAIVITDHTGTIQSVNPAFTALTGYSAAEVVGHNPRILKSGQQDEAFFHNMWQTISSGQVWSGTLTNRRKDGSLYDEEMTITPLRNAVGVIARYIAIKQDITERKRAEIALRESNEKFHQLANNITDTFWIRSPDLREIHYVSPAFETIWGRSVASLQANPQQWSDFILPEDRERVLGSFAAFTGDERNLDIEYRIVRPDGEIRWVRVRGFQIRDAANKLNRVAGIVTDITEAKLADEMLRRTETLYRTAIAGAGAVPYSLDFGTKSYGFMGEGIQQLIGYAPHEVSGQLWHQIILESVMTGEAAGLSVEEATRRMASGAIRNWQCDMRIRTRAGKVRWLSDASVQRLDAAGRPSGSMGILQDITERKQNEISALAFSKLGSRLSSVNSTREMFDSIKEVSRELFGWDAFCIRLYSASTDSFYSGFTIDTIAGQLIAEEQSGPKPPGELYRRIMAQGGELILRDQPTTYVPGIVPFGDVSRPSAVLLFVPIRSRGHVVGVLSVQSYTPSAYNEHDLKTLQTMADQCGGVIERILADEALRKTEAQLFQSQKLETVGKLAGGVAHEFNSILTAIIGQSELLLSDLPVGSPLSQNATEIRKAADRAATLTRQLLAYGRKQFLQPEALNLNRVIAGMDGVLRQLMGGDAVDVNIVLAVDLRLVKADAGQIEQVIMNLAINAREAMPNGGKLTLETGNVLLDQDSVGRSPELKPGDYVMLAITDTGTGMSAEVKTRAFEPFFSTKGVGQGTGLGLSTCYGIIKQSGGHISVYSEPALGSTFKIYLPQVEPPAKLPERRQDALNLPRGTETILLVEDDPALREMAAALLRRLGYTVLAAANGIEALSLKQQRDTGHVDLLFTDVVMPHMSGKELADRVQASFPQTRVLYTSAYTENAIVHQGGLKKGIALLQKPFTPAALAHKLREVLDQPVAPNLDSAQQSFGFTNSSGEVKPPRNSP